MIELDPIYTFDELNDIIRDYKDRDEPFIMKFGDFVFDSTVHTAAVVETGFSKYKVGMYLEHITPDSHTNLLVVHIEKVKTGNLIFLEFKDVVIPDDEKTKQVDIIQTK